MIGSVLERMSPGGEERISYGEDSLQFGHLRRPEGAGVHPALMLIHGGFWRNRYSLGHLEHLSAAFTREGFVTWNVEYRRVGDEGGGWPGTFHDVAAAAALLFEQAGSWNVDPNRVLVMGHSAGGHLASWLGCMANVRPDSDIRAEPLPWRGVVALAGVLDLVEAWVRRLSENAVVELMGGAPPEQPWRYHDASPVSLLPPPIPHLLIHGGQDHIVPVAMSEHWHQVAQEAGGQSRLLIPPRANHFGPIDPQARVWPDVLRAVQSLVENGA